MGGDIGEVDVFFVYILLFVVCLVGFWSEGVGRRSCILMVVGSANSFIIL